MPKFNPHNLTIDELRNQWPCLTELDRGESLAHLRPNEPSIRRLADKVGQPESTVRYLLHLADATQEQKQMLREGILSVRQVFLAVRARRAQQAKEATAFLFETVVGEHAESVVLIQSWLRETKVLRGNAERIIEHSLYILDGRSQEWSKEQRQRFPAVELGRAASLTEPGLVPEDPVRMVNVRGVWLSQWLLKRYLNPRDWIDTLKLALEGYRLLKAQ